MKTMFKDPTLQHQLEQDGFVHLPLLSEIEVTELADLFDAIRPAELRGISSNVQDNSLEDNLRVNRAITGIMDKYIQDLFLLPFLPCFW